MDTVVNMGHDLKREGTDGKKSVVIGTLFKWDAFFKWGFRILDNPLRRIFTNPITDLKAATTNLSVDMYRSLSMWESMPWSKN